MATFAEQLVSARKAAGMTQDELAGLAHVARNTISNWEHGRTRPDLDTMRLLSQWLHFDFLRGEQISQDETAGKTRQSITLELDREAVNLLTSGKKKSLNFRIIADVQVMLEDGEK